jgi:N-acetylglucosamine-6-phosphate deacetylase
MTLPTRFRGPGLVELQLNGYAGFDFNAPADQWTEAALHRVLDALRRRGVAIALPTLITDHPDRLLARAAAYRRIVERSPELATAFPLLHLEGPFISPEEGPRGAHPLEHCRTPAQLPDLVDRLVEASGRRLGMLTLAPELPGAPELIGAATARGIRVAIGHTRAGARELDAAVEAGAVLSTHLGNGSHQTLPRHANYLQLQLADDRLHASFIADGHHLPWYALQNFLRAKTPERSILVTDAISAADAPPGRYKLGDEEVEVTADQRVSKPGQPNLAGSALTLDRAVVNVARHCGIPFPTAWQMASTHPANLLGIPTPPDIEVEVSEAGFRI